MSQKISAMTAATNLASSVIPIVQGGANKKAAETLFSGYLQPGLLKDGATFLVPQYTSVAVGTIAATINSLRAVPYFVTQKITIDRLRLVVSVGAAGKARIGIYYPATDGTPGALLVDGGEQTITGAGNYDAVVNVTLYPGLYWFAAITDTGNTYNSFLNGTSSQYYPFYPNAGGTQTWVVAKAYGALPDPFTAGGSIPSANMNIMPYFRLA